MTIREFLIDLTATLGPDLVDAARARPSTDLKRDVHDVVTAHDKATEDAIRSAIFAAYPDSVFLGEEGGWHGPDGPVEEPTAPKVWIVDPIDGTSNFAAGWDHWCISIALIENGTPTVGVIAQPATGKVWSADESGAWLDWEGHEPRQLRVDPDLEPRNGLCATEFPHIYALSGYEPWENAARSFRSMRRTGSTALDLAYIAEGLTAASFSGAINPWDVAAGVLIIRRAGGIYEGYRDGQAITDAWNGPQFIAAQSEACADVLRKALP